MGTAHTEAGVTAGKTLLWSNLQHFRKSVITIELALRSRGRVDGSQSGEPRFNPHVGQKLFTKS